ncbi:MAG: biotin-dependent carboxyltransferase family protein [Candidatus Eremiobacteraeota bacterium]|nr:biotin-dependent carboxyltransferase family protein [Candidatus Eremiobacteraeota bacterium]MBC5828419.1 biotin-dependent carboxyltransferase family protein [Candidatus Eremiobacteraeota bacterium]
MKKPPAASMLVTDGGLLTTVQDRGRRWTGSFGVSPSGYADWLSARAANRLVANDDGAALIETTLTGAEFVLNCDARLALTGASADFCISDRPGRAWRCEIVRAGERVRIGPARTGLRNYLALAGGVRVPAVMDSASTDVAAGFGGYGGRGLKAGDVVPIGEPDASALRWSAYSSPASRPPAASEGRRSEGKTLRRAENGGCAAADHVLRRPAVLRILPGPHANVLGESMPQALAASVYRVSLRSNRQGLRLEGTPLPVGDGTGVLSGGVCAGCVQMLSDGLPVVLLSEHQTTGGYAVAACVIAADLPRAAQLRPFDEVSFAKVTQTDARQALFHALDLISSDSLRA